MNLLTGEQQDALIEVVNVGVSKSATVLSKLLKQRIDVSIPAIKLIDLKEMPTSDIFTNKSSVSYVYQQLFGGITGCIFLVYDENQTQIFMSPILAEAKKMKSNIKLIQQEGMLEVGNILVSSLLSGMVNVLKTSVDIGVPLYGHTSVEMLSKHLSKRSARDNQGDAKVFIFQAVLDTTIETEKISLDIILSMESIDKIIHSVNQLLGY